MEHSGHPPVGVPVVNTSPYDLPAYATAGSSGMDLRAHLQEPVALQPLERMLVPTGLYMAIPAGYEVQVRPRSGLAIRHGITCLNTPGTIDADYRGEVKVILINLSQQAYTIQPGERIAQMVLQAVPLVQWQPVQQLEDTPRGTGGFGHSGHQ